MARSDYDYLRHYFKYESSLLSLQEADKQESIELDEDSADDTIIVDSIAHKPTPSDAQFEMHGNYYKLIDKHGKRYIMAQGADGWRLSNVDYRYLKRHAVPVERIA